MGTRALCHSGPLLFLFEMVMVVYMQAAQGNVKQIHTFTIEGGAVVDA